MDDEIVVILFPPNQNLVGGPGEAHRFPATPPGYSAAIDLLSKYRAQLAPKTDEE